ncbi:60S ribosomal protein L28-like [Dromiciops gliroides]|uniref:60S ribosomal protein L28-like n=1 Tax=Dromiciops gliroides TaxID=33562 RepID=UPI001CC33D47|nr:60S ribosomal protein L28-like [Dromiciops gliroides]
MENGLTKGLEWDGLPHGLVGSSFPEVLQHTRDVSLPGKQELFELLRKEQKRVNKAPNSFRYNRLIHWKTVGMEPATDGKGIMVMLKWWSGQRKPATSCVRTTINENAQGTLNSVWHMIHKNKYQKDLHMAVLHQASAILWSQKPVVVKKNQTRPPKST